MTARREAENPLTNRTKEVERQRTAAEKLAELTHSRARREVPTDADELRRTLPDRHQARKQAGTDAGDQVGADRKTLERQQRERVRKQTDAETAVATDHGRQTSLIDQLAPAWRTHLNDLDANAVTALDAERRGNVAAQVAERSQQLDRDAAQRAVWVQQRDSLTAEIAAIAEDARIPVADAERAANAARTAATTAGRERDAAKEAANQLTRRAADRQSAVPIRFGFDSAAWSGPKPWRRRSGHWFLSNRHFIGFVAWSLW